MKHQHILVALMQNQPGVLNRVVSLFRRRAFNIDSLTVGRTERSDISRMTVVVDGENTDVEQVIKQLYKVIEVLKVSEITADPSVVSELALIKVTAGVSQRAEICHPGGSIPQQDRGRGGRLHDRRGHRAPKRRSKTC